MDVQKHVKITEGVDDSCCLMENKRDIIMNETCLPPLKWMYRNMSKLRIGVDDSCCSMENIEVLKSMELKENTSFLKCMFQDNYSNS